LPEIDSLLPVLWGWFFLPGLRMMYGCRLQLFVAFYSPFSVIKAEQAGIPACSQYNGIVNQGIRSTPSRPFLNYRYEMFFSYP